MCPLKKPNKSSTTALEWPHLQDSIANPATLAEAGFYYNPSYDDPDNVTCFTAVCKYNETGASRVTSTLHLYVFFHNRLCFFLLTTVVATHTLHYDNTAYDEHCKSHFPSATTTSLNHSLNSHCYSHKTTQDNHNSEDTVTRPGLSPLPSNE
jgi:hypothetical protein